MTNKINYVHPTRSRVALAIDVTETDGPFVNLNFGPIGIVGVHDTALVTGPAQNPHPKRQARARRERFDRERFGRHSGRVQHGVTLTKIEDQPVGKHAYGARLAGAYRVLTAEHSIDGQPGLIPGSPQVHPMAYYGDRQRCGIEWIARLSD